MSLIEVTQREDGVTIARLNRPKQLNSLTGALHQEFRALLDLLESNNDCRALILTGAGKAFCAGQDLRERVVDVGQPPIDIGQKLDQDLIPLIKRLRYVPFPVVAAVNGMAAGAGVSLALSADIIIAANSSKFAFSFVRVGLGPDGGLSWSLPRLVGGARASNWLLAGETITSEEAEQAGLVSLRVDDSVLMDRALSIAQRLSSAPRQAIIATKRALLTSPSSSFTAQMEVERDLQRRLGFSDDYREGVLAFLEKRPAQFRSPK